MTTKDKILNRMNDQGVTKLQKEISDTRSQLNSELNDLRYHLITVKDSRTAMRKDLDNQTSRIGSLSTLVTDLQFRLVEEESTVRSLTKENEELKHDLKELRG